MHIMLDLETMALSKKAAIISIGAVKFTLDGKLHEQFYRVVSLKSAQRAGGEIDAGTVMWWMEQSEAARNALLNADSVLIDVALKDFADWVRQSPLEGMWGNGSDFDNVVLESAYERSSKMAPWSYRVNRCYRTMAGLVPTITREPFRDATETHHNAVDDAKTQARHLCAILKHLNMGA